jgi:hypothetical protein
MNRIFIDMDGVLLEQFRALTNARKLLYDFHLHESEVKK